MNTIRFVCCVVALIWSDHIHGQNPTVQNLLNDVRLDSLVNFVKQLSGKKEVIINGVTDTIKSRHKLQPGNEKAFQFMKAEFIRYGYQVDSFKFGAQGKNLFAIKPGYKYPGKRIMLGAHYDNLPAQISAPGADDNASGSATVLEAGRVFRNYAFPYTIVFALWDEEEQGLVGSNAYVPTIAGNYALMGYVNVDMLGWDGNSDSIADINTKNIANSIDFADYSNYCNTLYNIGLNVHILNPGEESSDHASFWNEGYTAIAIGEEHHTDFYPYWHTSGDSITHFNLSFYQKCSKLAYATIAHFAADTISTLGIPDFANQTESPLIYPNPFTSAFYVKAIRDSNRPETIRVVNNIGERVLEQDLSLGLPVSTPSDLPQGMYIAFITSEHGESIKKLVKH